jgi:hypothetical protein
MRWISAEIGYDRAVLVATASAFFAVGFSSPKEQTHDELKRKFVVATPGNLFPLSARGNCLSVV